MLNDCLARFKGTACRMYTSKNKGCPRCSFAVILGLLYHPILFMFLWAYYKIVYTEPKGPPMQVCSLPLLSSPCVRSSILFLMQDMKVSIDFESVFKYLCFVMIFDAELHTI